VSAAGLGLVVAFLAGIVSFASPCVLPLVPAYVGYMVGSTPDGGATRKRVALYQALAFVAGFSLVFILLWASVGVVGYVLQDQIGVLRTVGGAILIFFGLNMAGVISFSAFYREARLPVGPMGGSFGFGQPVGAPSLGRSALLGIVFAAGWTPCIGPMLGGILGLAMVSSTVAEGTVLLIAYAAGLAIPFILVALGATAVSRRLGWFRKHQRAVDLIAGAMLVAVGFLMITNSFAKLSGLLPAFGL
jgi:cytochrome c-type biogenesis protein